MGSGRKRIIRRRLRSAYISSVISISLVLLLVGVAGLLLVNTRNITDYFKENLQLSVMLKPEVEEDAAYLYKGKLDSLPFVRSVELVSRAQGEAEMRQMLGEDFLSVFETSPIPVSYNLNLKSQYVDPDSLAKVGSFLETYSIVDEVVYQQSLVEALSHNMGKIAGVIGVMIVVLLFISFVLINGMMRLSVYDKRFSIHTMRLVGATKGFIRRPFVARAVLMGLVSSVIAILLLVLILYGMKSQIPQLVELFTLPMLLVVFGIVVAAGLMICAGTTYVVVGRLVDTPKEDLYF